LSSDTLLPSTELEAVNDMLGAISESPVSSIEEDQPDAQLALQLLRQENKAVQAEAWYWNTDECFKLLPNGSGEFVLPAGAMQVDTVGVSAQFDVSPRQGKLYDRRKQTFQIAATELYVRLTVLLSYEDIPQAARDYIRIRAGRKFIKRVTGATENDAGYEAKDEAQARANIEIDEESGADRSLFDNPDFARLMRDRRPLNWPN
jgi:hypothetical protein